MVFWTLLIDRYVIGLLLTLLAVVFLTLQFVWLGNQGEMEVFCLRFYGRVGFLERVVFFSER